ncbi:MAG: hypothetical protein AAF719_04760 [Pseudomonadota bacterium]
MMHRVPWIIGAVLIVLSACVSTSPSIETPDGAPREQNSPTVYEFGDEALTIDELPAQQLSDGECGLFLFASQPSARFVFFAEAGAGIGKMQLNGDTVSFARTEASGDVFDMHFSEQTYQSPTAQLELALSLRPGEGDASGTRLNGGSLRLTRPNGWTMVTQVSGATTCGAALNAF